MSVTRRGIALLEVLAATALLSLAGLSLLAVLDGESQALGHDKTREREIDDEDRLLTAYTLLNRQDLETRLGTSASGPYLVEIQRPTVSLFRIAIRRAASPKIEDLVTVLFLPETQRAL